MEKIDLTTWDRTKYFNMYRKSDFPYVNAAADVDVTDIYRFAREKGCFLQGMAEASEDHLYVLA